LFAAKSIGDKSCGCLKSTSTECLLGREYAIAELLVCRFELTGGWQNRRGWLAEEAHQSVMFCAAARPLRSLLRHEESDSDGALAANIWRLFAKPPCFSF
jgi:hypothetical protein